MLEPNEEKLVDLLSLLQVKNFVDLLFHLLSHLSLLANISSVLTNMTSHNQIYNSHPIMNN